jgi:hypothetical protein
MRTHTRVFAVWTVAGILALTLLAVVARPMAIAWRCYDLNASGERSDAEVVHKVESPTLVLRIATGTRSGEACTAKTSAAHHEALEIGDPLAIVHRADRPDECVLVATIENSAIVLWSLTAGLGGVVLLILAGAVLITRSFTASPFLTSYMDVDAKRVSCPQCGAEMAEGYLALLAGLHWRDAGEPIGLPHALSGLPGTVGWRARPRLHAFRCESCSIVTFKYGLESARRQASGP